MFDWLRSVLPYMHAMATFGGRNSGLFPGRHLFLLDGATVGPKRFGKNSLASSHAKKAKVARAFFQTSWCQGCFYCAVYRFVSTGRGQFVGRHVENAMAHLSFFYLTGIALIVLGLMFRHPLVKFSERHFSKKRK